MFSEHGGHLACGPHAEGLAAAKELLAEAVGSEKIVCGSSGLVIKR